jgi:cytochrome c biogenesis protein CcmG/thiol:disulfide interchange protein DsbE
VTGPGRRHPRGGRRRRAAAAPTVLVALALGLTGCVPADQAGGPTVDAPADGGIDGADLVPQQSNVDVDTPALRRQKQAAGIEPCPAPTRPVTAAEPLPELTLPCLGGGQPVDLSTLRGPLVVNVFAQWCGPCREELPLFARLDAEAGDEVALLGIDHLDTQPAGALELVAESGVRFPLVADPDGLLKPELRLLGLPRTLFVDAEGEVVAQAPGVIRSYEELTGLVEQHLGVVVGAAG